MEIKDRIKRLRRNLELLKEVKEDVEALKLAENLLEEQGLEFTDDEKGTLQAYRDSLPNIDRVVSEVEAIFAKKVHS